MRPEQNSAGDVEGLWLTITELANFKGLGKPAISERVARFEAAGKLATRPGAGRSKLVNVAEFDRAAGEIGDLGREQGAATRRGAMIVPAPAPPPRPLDPDAPVYTVEQARSMAYKAELLRLELQEKEGKIVSVEVVRASAVRAGEEIVRIIDRLEQAADELSVALGKSGSHGVRLALKRIGLAMRNDIADALAQTTAECLRSAPGEVVPDPGARTSVPAACHSIES